MKKEKRKFDHLINNLERISSKNSVFNSKSGRKAFLSLGQENIYEWLETLLPNTRLILEPKIIGSIICIQYTNGNLSKAINELGGDITDEIKLLRSVPKRLPIKKRFEIRGVIYDNENRLEKNIKMSFLDLEKAKNNLETLNFCAFQIFHCKINHFQSLQELKKLNFKIPETFFTKFISEIEIYRQCWKEGRLFKSYPTSGIILKINSRKLQKRIGENNLSINWAYAIN